MYRNRQKSITLVRKTSVFKWMTPSKVVGISLTIASFIAKRVTSASSSMPLPKMYKSQSSFDTLVSGAFTKNMSDIRA